MSTALVLLCLQHWHNVCDTINLKAISIMNMNHDTCTPCWPVHTFPLRISCHTCNILLRETKGVDVNVPCRESLYKNVSGGELAHSSANPNVPGSILSLVSWVMMRYVSCILLLEWSTTSQRQWVCGSLVNISLWHNFLHITCPIDNKAKSIWHCLFNYMSHVTYVHVVCWI